MLCRLASTSVKGSEILLPHSNSSFQRSKLVRAVIAAEKLWVISPITATSLLLLYYRDYLTCMIDHDSAQSEGFRAHLPQRDAARCRCLHVTNPLGVKLAGCKIRPRPWLGIGRASLGTGLHLPFDQITLLPTSLLSTYILSEHRCILATATTTAAQSTQSPRQTHRYSESASRSCRHTIRLHHRTSVASATCRI